MVYHRIVVEKLLNNSSSIVIDLNRNNLNIIVLRRCCLRPDYVCRRSFVINQENCERVNSF